MTHRDVMNNWNLMQSLKRRGLTQIALAKLAGVGRSHLSMVLSNVPGRGGHTRRKLFPHLTWEEILMLGWAAEYTAWQKKEAAKLEQRSTENNVSKNGVAA